MLCCWRLHVLLYKGSFLLLLHELHYYYKTVTSISSFLCSFLNWWFLPKFVFLSHILIITSDPLPELHDVTHRGSVLCPTDVRLVGYVGSAGMWSCCVLVSVPHRASSSEDRGGKMWALSLEQVTTKSVAGSLSRTQGGSCLLQPFSDDRTSPQAVKWHFFNLSVSHFPPTTFNSCARIYHS